MHQQGWTGTYREKAGQLDGWDHCPLNQVNRRKGTCASRSQQLNQRLGPDGFRMKQNTNRFLWSLTP